MQIVKLHQWLLCTAKTVYFCFQSVYTYTKVNTLCLISGLLNILQRCRNLHFPSLLIPICWFFLEELLVLWDRVFPSYYIKSYGCFSSVLSVCVSVPPEWLSGLCQTVQLMSFPNLPSIKAEVLLSPVFLAIDYQRKPISFGVYGLYQMPMDSKIIKEGGEECEKQENCHVIPIFPPSLDELFLQWMQSGNRQFCRFWIN